MLSSVFKYLREFSSSKCLWQQQSQVHFFLVCQEWEVHILSKGVCVCGGCLSNQKILPSSSES